MVTLGHGRASPADNIEARDHQTWLAYGPRMDTLRRANSAVHQCLSDMGTEFGLVDAPDVAHLCSYGHGPVMPGQWLYPYALQIPGTQHILDTILRDGLCRLEWWTSWETEAKVVCQWLHQKPHREFLPNRLDHNDTELVQSLDASCESFAEWRWKTLAHVTRDLQRMQRALRESTEGVQAKELALRDSVQAHTFLMSVKYASFVNRCGAWSVIAKPVSDLFSWIRGCPCHELQCMSDAGF